jgi:hypothetical protein
MSSDSEAEKHNNGAQCFHKSKNRSLCGEPVANTL